MCSFSLILHALGELVDGTGHHKKKKQEKYNKTNTQYGRHERMMLLFEAGYSSGCMQILLVYENGDFKKL